MNKIIKKQVLATFAVVTIMAGVLIGTNCIYAAQDGKETTTIRLINQTYFNVKNIKVTWNDGKEQTVNTLGSHDSIDFSSDAGSVIPFVIAKNLFTIYICSVTHIVLPSLYF